MQGWGRLSGQLVTVCILEISVDAPAGGPAEGVSICRKSVSMYWKGVINEVTLFT